MYLCEQKSINKVLRNHGGLHNCVTYRLPVLPFTLHECKQYMRAKKIQASHYDLLEYYIVFGRAPFFCSLLTLGQSVTQNVDKLIFAEDGKLRYEFNELYDSLLRNPEKYVSIVMELGENGAGMTRDELVKQCELEEDGRTSRMQEDLEECGFIRKIPTYGLKNLATFPDRAAAHYKTYSRHSQFRVVCFFIKQLNMQYY